MDKKIGPRRPGKAIGHLQLDNAAGVRQNSQFILLTGELIE
jgi:hypothetical protein